MLIKKLFTILVFLLIYRQAFSQFTDNQSIREDFIFEVIQIEEFIQRFNFEEDNRLFTYLKSATPDLKLNRKSVLYSLMNYSNPDISKETIQKFIDFIADTSAPVCLDFYDSGWFGEVNCIMQKGASAMAGKIFLKNQVSEQNTSKWVIVGVRSELLSLPNSSDTSNFFSPVSHATDFVAIYNFFEDTRNLPNYLSKDYTIDTLTYFVSLVINRKLKLNEIVSVKYHFTQIPDWIVVIEYFNRREPNSGWLISKLIPASDIEKKNYIRSVLCIH
jgi:hypothetical protein